MFNSIDKDTSSPHLYFFIRNQLVDLLVQLVVLIVQQLILLLQKQTQMVTIDNINLAANNLEGIAMRTPLQYNFQLSEEFGCNIYLKREDLQVVRSYKIRGAYNKISSLTDSEKKNGVVCPNPFHKSLI